MKFQEIIDEIDRSISVFSKKLSSTQDELLNKLLKSIKELELNGNNIKMTGKNIKLLLQIKSKLATFIVNDEYKEAIEGLVKSYEKIEQLQNAYFNKTLDNFKPPQITRQIRNQSAQLVIDQLTGSLSQQVKEQIGKKLLQAVTSQTSKRMSRKYPEANLISIERHGPFREVKIQFMDYKLSSGNMELSKKILLLRNLMKFKSCQNSKLKFH